jgi:phosphate transport system substrate-binding protein
LETRAGKFIKPSDERGSIAIAVAETTEDTSAALGDPGGEKAYPIVTLTWMLVYRRYGDREHAEMIKDFVMWCLTEGQRSNHHLGYVPLSPALISSAILRIDLIGKNSQGYD